MIKNQNFIKKIKKNIFLSVKNALIEDLGKEINICSDITSSLLEQNRNTVANVFTQENGILCGTTWFEEVFQQIERNIKINWHVSDGESIKKNQLLCDVHGPAQSILVGERTALNFLQMLSGVSTKVKSYVKLLKNTNVKLRDTRKTIPGLRCALKYAVICGGAYNHRMGLFDSILIKDNHIKHSQSIKYLVSMAKLNFPHLPIEIEVENLEEFQEALDAKTDIIMLDNFSYQNVKRAVEMNKNKAILEASGNLTIKNLVQFASTGVDYLAIGKFTKDITSLDFTMHVN